MKNIEALFYEIDEFPIKQDLSEQIRLDLVKRNRVSLFPWRGQFSPELIQFLLEKYAASQSIVLDPFVGSGTVLFEAAHKTLTCFGTDINPAVAQIAKTAHFVNIEVLRRTDYIHRAESIIKKHLAYYETDLFGERQPLEQCLQKMLWEAISEPLVSTIILNAIIYYYAASCNRIKADMLFNSFNRYKAIVEELPFSPRPCKFFYADARKLPLENESVDLIITSPPYINVFNYHQNMRKAMELVGLKILKLAKSEIGSNRKNRGNRFLTVVQYTIDMLQALCEMRRIIRPNGRVIVIAGRESKVRGVGFQNGRLLAALATRGAGLHLVLRQQRKYTNRFGKVIYEDLLHFVPSNKSQEAKSHFARNLSQYILSEAEAKSSGEVRNEIMKAKAQAMNVKASPILKPRTIAEKIWL